MKKRVDPVIFNDCPIISGFCRRKEQFDIAFDLVHISQTGFLYSFYDDNDYNNHYKQPFSELLLIGEDLLAKCLHLIYTFTFLWFLFLFFNTDDGISWYRWIGFKGLWFQLHILLRFGGLGFILQPFGIICVRTLCLHGWVVSMRDGWKL